MRAYHDGAWMVHQLHLKQDYPNVQTSRGFGRTDSRRRSKKGAIPRHKFTLHQLTQIMTGDQARSK
jgi:hypothetical protein